MASRCVHEHLVVPHMCALTRLSTTARKHCVSSTAAAWPMLQRQQTHELGMLDMRP